VIKVLVADDQRLVRAGLRSLLQAEPDLSVVAEAADGQQAVRHTAAYSPDVVLMDVRMPGLDGIAATRQMRDLGHPARVLILTTYDLDEYVFAALRAGAAGFLLKDTPSEQLAAGIRLVASGEGLLAPAQTGRLIAEFASAGAPDPTKRDRLASLTDRERTVLQALARGGTNAEIARALFVTPATVKTHIANILAKLGLRDRVHAVIYAYESGLARPGG
jgi:DNA-binding NarL/FixJ family response regulator